MKFSQFNHKNCIEEILSQRNNMPFQTSIIEMVHVLAHCLNECQVPESVIQRKNQMIESGDPNLNLFFFSSICKLLSKTLINTLGSSYSTCQATIFAEIGCYEEALSLLDDYKPKSQEDKAEKDFYYFYFSELFSDLVVESDSRLVGRGNTFLDYCNNAEISIIDKTDALLHYYIVKVKKEIRIILDKVFSLGDFANSEFMNCCFPQEMEKALEYIRSNNFSFYVHKDIVNELEMLRTSIDILQEIKHIKLPLLHSIQENNMLYFDRMNNRLFSLCKKYNKINGKQITKKTHAISYEPNNVEVKTYTIDDICFDVFAINDSDFRRSFCKLFSLDECNAETVEQDYCIFYGKKESAKSLTKIILCSEEVAPDLYDYLFCNMYSVHNHILGFTEHHWASTRIYIVGNEGHEFSGTPIVELETVDDALVMSYIYETLEKILRYICKPKQVAILMPLRDTSSYCFQAVQDMNFIPFIDIPSSNFKVCSSGLGTTMHFHERETYKAKNIYIRPDIQGIFICGMIYDDSEDEFYTIKKLKFEESEFYQLIPLRIQDTSHRMMRDFYRKYISLRKNRVAACSYCTNPVCNMYKKTSSVCQFLFGRLSDLVRTSIKSMEEDKQVSIQKAADLLTNLIILACHENVFDVKETYIFEHVNPNRKLLCFFSDDIKKSEVCCSEWISDGGDYISENTSKIESVDIKPFLFQEEFFLYVLEKHLLAPKIFIDWFNCNDKLKMDASQFSRLKKEIARSDNKPFSQAQRSELNKVFDKYSYELCYLNGIEQIKGTLSCLKDNYRIPEMTLQIMGKLLDIDDDIDAFEGFFTKFISGLPYRN